MQDYYSFYVVLYYKKEVFSDLLRVENGNRTLGFFPLCINMLQRSLVF